MALPAPEEVKEKAPEVADKAADVADKAPEVKAPPPPAGADRQGRCCGLGLGIGMGLGYGMVRAATAAQGSLQYEQIIPAVALL